MIYMEIKDLHVAIVFSPICGPITIIGQCWQMFPLKVSQQLNDPMIPTSATTSGGRLVKVSSSVFMTGRSPSTATRKLPRMAVCTVR